MAVIINASTSTGLVQSADTSGIIQFQSNGSTKATLNSSGFSYPGGVLQVVQAFYSTETSIASTSFTDSGLTASITPTSSSSKILIIASVMADSVQASNVVNLSKSRLVKGATQLAIFEMYFGAGTSSNGYIYYPMPHTLTYLDSPATTSSTTYKVQGNINSTSSSAGLRYQINSSSSTMTLLEIAA